MNGIANKMGTLICHNNRWTTRLDENVVIQKLWSNNNCIGATMFLPPPT